MVKKKIGKYHKKKALSRGDGQVYDLTRKIFGIDSEHLSFQANRRKVGRLIDSSKKHGYT